MTQPWPMWALAGVGLWGLYTLRRPKAPRLGSADDLFGRPDTPPALASPLEERLGLRGFSDFEKATAYTESRGNPNARHDDPRDVAASQRAWDRARDLYFAQNPYPEERWTQGGYGLHGMLPTTALVAEGMRNEDPHVLFDPWVSKVLLVDFVHRVVTRYFPELPPECRTWLTIRRFMASNTVGFDCAERSDRAKGVRRRLTQALEAIGADPALMDMPVRFDRGYPGAVVLIEDGAP